MLVDFTLSAPAFGASETFTTGKEWVEKMSRKEKFISLFAPMILFHRYGVPFRKTPDQYISQIDKVLLYNPYLEPEDMADIFASTVYAYEPESRPAFDALAVELHERNEANELILPRLRLQPSSRQQNDQ